MTADKTPSATETLCAHVRTPVTIPSVPANKDAPLGRPLVREPASSRMVRFLPDSVGPSSTPQGAAARASARLANYAGFLTVTETWRAVKRLGPEPERLMSARPPSRQGTFKAGPVRPDPVRPMAAISAGTNRIPSLIAAQ